MKQILFFAALLLGISANAQLTYCSVGEQYQICDQDGKAISSELYDAVEQTESGFVVWQGDKIGALHLETGKVLFAVGTYDLVAGIGDYPNLWLVRKGSEAAIFDMQKGKIVSPKFDADKIEYRFGLDGMHAYVFNDEVIAVKSNNKWGAINLHGAVIIPFEYDELQTTYYGLNYFGVACKNGTCKLINKKGKVISTDIFDQVVCTVNEFLVVKQKNKVTFLDTSMVEYAQYPDTTKKYLEARKNGRGGIIDLKGNVVVDFKYDYTAVNQDVFTCGFDGGYLWLFGTDGKQISDSSFSSVGGYFSSDPIPLMVVEKDGLYGMIDKQGKLVVPLQYDYLYEHDGYKIVTLGDKNGYLDKHGKLVIPCQYESAYYFGEGDMAGVNLNGKWGFIDTTGKVKIPIKYDSVDYFRNGKAEITLNGKKGYLTLDGKEHF